MADLTFQLGSTATRSGSALFCTAEGAEHSIETPAVIDFSNRGFCPNLTNDNALGLPVEALYLSLEHLCGLLLDTGDCMLRAGTSCSLDLDPPLFSQAPFSLSRYLGHDDTSAPLLWMGLKDPTRINRTAPPSADTHVCINTIRGASKVLTFCQ